MLQVSRNSNCQARSPHRLNESNAQSDQAAILHDSRPHTTAAPGPCAAQPGRQGYGCVMPDTGISVTTPVYNKPAEPNRTISLTLRERGDHGMDS